MCAKQIVVSKNRPFEPSCPVVTIIRHRHYGKDKFNINDI
jgi:hypothetical protein